MNNPLYLGKPMKLGKSALDEVIGMTFTAWTTNLTASVDCDGAVLYRWNLNAYDSFRKVSVPPGATDPFEKEEYFICM